MVVMAIKHNNRRLWSSNVTYTGLTNIHSDTQPGATARNTLANRRASCSLTVESNLHQKELRALDLNKQALKNSMLAYTQKMQILSAKKSDQTFVRKIQARAKTDIPRSLESSTTSAICSTASSEPFANDKKHPTKDDFKCFPLSPPDSRKKKETDSRLSIDSGICVDNETDNPESMSDIDLRGLSDSCCSDSESIASSSYLSTKSETLVPNQLKGVEMCETTAVSDSETVSRDDVPRRKKRFRRKWQIGKENPLLPTVQDNEPTDDVCIYAPCENKTNTEFSLQPFPVDDLEKRCDLPGITPSSVSGSIFRSIYPAYSVTKPSADEQMVTFKPKPVQSPSVASIRLRHPRKKPRQENKQFQHRFRYSELFEKPLENPKVGDEQNVSLTTQLESSNLKDFPMGAIQEMAPELETEDSISVSPFAEIDAFANVKVISELGEKILKSALKPKRNSESHRSKHVHFFLPDIFNR